MLLVKEEFLKLNMVNSFHPIILSLKDSRTVCIVPMVCWYSQEEKMGCFLCEYWRKLESRFVL